ncbi:hypothetical protein D3C80_1393670 [compost metagenome]
MVRMRIPESGGHSNIIIRRPLKSDRLLIYCTLPDKALAEVKILLEAILGITGIKGACQKPVRVMKIFQIKSPVLCTKHGSELADEGL